MNIYEIDYQINESDTLIYFSEKDSVNLFKFFILDEKIFSSLENIRAFAQSNLTNELIKSLDFINAVINAPVFSEKFVSSLGGILNNEIDFYPIYANDNKLYIGRILNKMNIIDCDKSEYMDLTNNDEDPILYNAVYLNDFDKEFFITRDYKERTKYVVSEKFKELLIENKIDIKLRKVN